MLKKIIKKLTAVLLSAILGISVFTGRTAGIYAEGESEQWNTYAYNPYYGGWSNCTWSAWQLVYESTGIALPSFGNAGQWAASAMAAGYYVSGIPAANTIAVWSGHVAYVTDVSEDGSLIYIKEGGWGGGYNEGWYNSFGARTWQAFLGYIYLGDPPAFYYTPDDLALAYSGLTQRNTADADSAANQRLAAREEEKIIRIDDAAADEVIKSVERDAIQDLQEEDRNYIVESLE
ncbi:MAG: CHAP domain-containing protein [Solobacterium sp.]|nr:CHAP domain-containing protein [Solobacterium sp.]